MGALDHSVLATLLLSLFWFVLSTAMLLIFFICRWRRYRNISGFSKSGDDDRKADDTPTHTGQHHAVFKRPSCWLAIKSRNLLAVQSALALHNSKPCSWAEGLSGNSDQKLFVSPPVGSWILVIGPALPEPSDDVDACYRFLVELSRKLGQVQFFSSNSVLSHHAWVQIEVGRVVRAYAWAGKTLWNQGKMTQAEQELSLKCFDYAEPMEFNPFGLPEPIANNLDRVHLLASRWSVDPDEIDERFIEQEWGIVGEPSKRF